MKATIVFKEKDLKINTIFFGDRKVIFPELKKSLQSFYGENILLFQIEKMNLSVDEIRAMKDFVSKTFEGTKIVILSSFYWNEAVQNAMLKVLEETPENTKIFLIGLSKNFFLPTVLSRMQKVSLENASKFDILVREILFLSPNQRLGNKKVIKLLAQKVEEINFFDNEVTTKKDREEHILFLQALIDEILKFKNDKLFLEKINKITQHIYDVGGSPHLFIEWLLLSAPQV